MSQPDPAPTSPSPDAGLPAEDVKSLRDSRHRRDEAYHEWKALAAQAKEAKAAYEAEVGRHEMIERQLLNPQQEFALEAGPSEPVTMEPPAPAEDDDTWRRVSLREVLEDYSLWGPLEESELYTMGQLADHGKKKALTDVVGIGERKADRINERLDTFWANRRPPMDQNDDEAAAEDEPAEDEDPEEDAA
jgi:hypothetical protein